MSRESGYKRCGKPLAYDGAVFCGAACTAQWEAGDRSETAPTEAEMSIGAFCTRWIAGLIQWGDVIKLVEAVRQDEHEACIRAIQDGSCHCVQILERRSGEDQTSVGGRNPADDPNGEERDRMRASGEKPCSAPDSRVDAESCPIEPDPSNSSKVLNSPLADRALVSAAQPVFQGGAHWDWEVVSAGPSSPEASYEAGRRSAEAKTVCGFKVGDEVLDLETNREGVIRRIVEGDEWPKPYAWVENETDRWDIELKYLRCVSRSNEAKPDLLSAARKVLRRWHAGGFHHGSSGAAMQALQELQDAVDHGRGRESVQPKHYSGDASANFWRRIERLPDEEHGYVYELGCRLQQLESKALAALAVAEDRASAKASPDGRSSP